MLTAVTNKNGSTTYTDERLGATVRGFGADASTFREPIKYCASKTGQLYRYGGPLYDRVPCGRVPTDSTQADAVQQIADQYHQRISKAGGWTIRGCSGSTKFHQLT